MKTILATVAAIALATSVNAATYTTTAGPDVGPGAGESVVFDFNQATPELSGNFNLVTGTSGTGAAPLGDTTQYLVVPGSGSSGAATLDLSGFSNPIKSFSFYWGSIDTYNSIELLNGANVFQTILGGSLPPATGNQGSPATNVRAFFTLGAGENLTGIRFVSDNLAFEVDDFAISSVPEASTWAMLLMGFGMIGFAARRGRPTVVSA